MWIIALHGYDIYCRATYHQRSFLFGVTQLAKSHWAMTFAHIGFALTLIGISMVQNYSIEKDIRLNPGQNYSIAGYDVYFHGVTEGRGDNYHAYIGQFDIKKDGNLVNQLFPEKRFYLVSKMVMTETAIDRGLFRDLYIALGEPLGRSKAWAVRVYYKPFIRWIWLGGGFMIIGGIISLSDKRYRLLSKVS